LAVIAPYGSFKIVPDVLLYTYLFTDFPSGGFIDRITQPLFLSRYSLPSSTRNRLVIRWNMQEKMDQPMPNWLPFFLLSIGFSI